MRLRVFSAFGQGHAETGSFCDGLILKIGWRLGASSRGGRTF